MLLPVAGAGNYPIFFRKPHTSTLPRSGREGPWRWAFPCGALRGFGYFFLRRRKRISISRKSCRVQPKSPGQVTTSPKDMKE